MIVSDAHKSCQGMLYLRPYKSHWHINETLEQFIQNCKKHPEKMQGWHKESVSYTLNKYGFRSHYDFDKFDRPKNTWLALGCSKTFGLGLPKQELYTSLLEKHFDCKIINLGIPGGSLDSCYRVCKLWFNVLNPNFVLIQKPHKSRREVLQDNGMQILGPWHEDFVKFKISIQSDTEINDDFYEIKILDAIQSVLGNTKSLVFDFQDAMGDCDDLSRDLIHSGPKTNSAVCQYLLPKIKFFLP